MARAYQSKASGDHRFPFPPHQIKRRAGFWNGRQGVGPKLLGKNVLCHFLPVFLSIFEHESALRGKPEALTSHREVFLGLTR